MLSMSVIATNDAPTKSVYLDGGGGSGVYGNEQTAGQDCKPYGLGAQIAGNSIFTRFANSLPLNGAAKDKKSNLIECYEVRKQAGASGEATNENPELDTKQCQVVLPKLTKSLDVHINKIKTINLNRLKVLVAKNVVKRDLVSLDMTRQKSETPPESRDPLPKKSDDDRKDCRDVLSQILDRVVTEMPPAGQKKQPEMVFNKSCLESKQISINNLVDKIVTELSDVNDVNVDIRSVSSSDYGSLKLSENESEHEEVLEIRTVDLGDDNETKNKLVLDWLDTDRLPTPSPPNSPEPKDGNCSDKEREEVADPADAAEVPGPITTSKSHRDISTETTNVEKKISPLKLCLTNIKSASCAKTLDRITKKFNRLTLSNKESKQQTANCEEQIEVQTPTPSIVIYATVDNNCIIETVDFSDGNRSSKSPEAGRSKSSDVRSSESVSEAKDAKEKCKKTKSLSLEVLESKVDEVSRNLQFDLEDTMSFKQSAIDLLSNKKLISAKRKKSGQSTSRKPKKKQLQVGNAEKTTKNLKDDNNCLFRLNDDVQSPTANNSTESNQSDEEFCPSDNSVQSNYEPSSRKTRSKCGLVPEDLCIDKTLTYKKMLRKRQSVNFLDIDSDDFEVPSPSESKKQRNNKKHKANVEENELELAAKTDMMVSSIKSICQLGAIKAPPVYSAMVMDLPKDKRVATSAEKRTLNQEATKPLVQVNKTNSVVNDSELIFDTPLDLSKKVLDEQTRNPDSQQTSNNEQLPPKTAVSEPETKQPECTTDEGAKKIVDEKQRLEEEIKQTINKCKEESLLEKAKLAELTDLTGTLSPLQFSSLNAFPFGIYNAELFQNEYQRLQKELTTLDFVAQQKERERNNILQLKKQRIAAMQQLQLRKQFLAQVQAKVQPLSNSPLTTTTATTTTTAIQIRQPLPISTSVSTLFSNKNYQAQDCSSAATLTTSTEVTPSVRPNAFVIRPIVTKAIPSNKPVMPLRPKFNPPYPHCAMHNPNWLRNQLQVSSAGYNQYSLNSVQTIISKASENIGMKWANDNPKAPSVPVINQRILKGAIAAQRRDLPPVNSQSNNQIKQMKKQNESGSAGRPALPNTQFAEDSQSTKVTCLLTINQNYNNKVNPTSRKMTPRWPSCQNCQNQIARYICAGCNKQWYCSEKCQLKLCSLVQSLVQLHTVDRRAYSVLCTNQAYDGSQKCIWTKEFPIQRMYAYWSGQMPQVWTGET